MTNEPRMVTWKYKSCHFAPEISDLDDEGKVRVGYIETCEPCVISLPESVEDPCEFLNLLSIEDEMADVLLANFQRTEMVTWDYEVTHSVPDVADIDEDGKVVVSYVPKCEQMRISLPSCVEDPLPLLADLSVRDMVDCVTYSDFTRVEDE